MTIHHGKGICPGIAFARAYFLQTPKPHHTLNTISPAEEWAAFVEAKTHAHKQLDSLKDQTGIIAAQALMLDDAEFNQTVHNIIMIEGLSAIQAVLRVGRHFSHILASSRNSYIHSRSTDVIDITQRLADTLSGHAQNYHLAGPTIIIAHDLAPSQVLQIDKTHIHGIILKGGAENSHAVILIKALGIPCIIQTDITAVNGKEIALDATAGLCYVEPDETTISALQQKQQTAATPQIPWPGNMRLLANISNETDLQAALQAGCDGVGLFRTEFAYLNRPTCPTEDELFAIYSYAAKAMKGKDLMIRTADFSSDKWPKFLCTHNTKNPAMGLRGVHVYIQHPQLLKTQLRAILRASAHGSVSVIFPMISSMRDVDHCKSALKATCQELSAKSIPVGIMIETPAAVLISDQLARKVDFFAIGTNDLTRYISAAGRQDNSPTSVLQLIAKASENAKLAGIKAYICGEIAANSQMTETLVSMGFDGLSVAPIYIPQLRGAT
ncbi:MAG: PEP-utilizing enzyme [Defluviitaleaceae bacterium]|nr:PEP-utilizing enzyme [Defluviitaleaceae bacterium]